jgi:hypothetical protein
MLGYHFNAAIGRRLAWADGYFCSSAIDDIPAFIGEHNSLDSVQRNTRQVAVQTIMIKWVVFAKNPTAALIAISR